MPMIGRVLEEADLTYDELNAIAVISARALGLDVGAMSGFDNAGVDGEFFPRGNVKSNFLCNLGIGNPAGLFDRSPRFDFDEMAEIL